jgi:transmembrane sensor
MNYQSQHFSIIVDTLNKSSISMTKNYLKRVTKNICYLIVIMMVFASCSQTSVTTDDSFEGIELPDGSIILLNRQSSIDFDKDFNPRQVNLTGEAYFKVTSGDIPFTVITALGEIEVLGTKFNVIASDDELEVEVVSGEVELRTDTEERKLSRGQRAEYHRNEDQFEFSEAKFKFKIWLKELEIEFKKLGKEIKKESKKLGKELKQEGKKLDKRLHDMN